MKKLKSILYYTLCVVCLWIIATSGTMAIQILFPYKDLAYTDEQDYAVTAHIQQQIRDEFMDLPQLTKKEWGEKIEKRLHPLPYIHIEVKEMPFKIAAAGMFIPPAMTILTLQELDTTGYARTMFHELIHFTKWTANETRTQWLSFKLAYESKDPYLRYLGLHTAISILGGHEPRENINYGKMYGAYDCSGRIIHYFNTLCTNLELSAT